MVVTTMEAGAWPLRRMRDTRTCGYTRFTIYKKKEWEFNLEGILHLPLVYRAQLACASKNRSYTKNIP